MSTTPKAIRFLSLALCAACFGCVSDRHLSDRLVDGITVVGPYSDTDVASILSALRAYTARPVHAIGPRVIYATNTLRRDELDAVPIGVAVVTLRAEEEMVRAYVYRFGKQNGGWVLQDSSIIVPYERPLPQPRS